MTLIFTNYKSNVMEDFLKTLEKNNPSKTNISKFQFDPGMHRHF